MRRLALTALAATLPFQALDACKIIAHRGNSSETPENTLAAFSSAVDVGADMIECDIQIAADGVPVIIHDSTARRTAGVPERVRSLSSGELASLDAGVWFDERFAGARVPTLREALESVHPPGGWMLELKGKGFENEDSVRRVIEAIESSGVSSDKYILGSMCVTALDHVRQERPHWPVIAIVNPKSNRVEQFHHLRPAAYAVRKDLATPDLVSELRQRKSEIWVWTVDDLGDAEALFELGIDGLISNKPRDVLNKLQASLQKPAGLWATDL